MAKKQVVVYINDLNCSENRSNVNFQQLKVSCGSGQQSFKWLGNVISERLLREELRVVGIRNMNKELINPIDLIVEHCVDDEISVIAEVASSISSDEYDFPLLSAWQVGAYIRSEDGMKWTNEIEQWRMRDETNAVEIDFPDESNSPTSSRAIVIGDSFSSFSASLNKAFDLDWKNIHWNWLEKPVAENDRKKMLEVVKRNYHLVYNFFQHYCGLGVLGRRYGMSMFEFQHFFHNAKLLNASTDHLEIDGIYKKVVLFEGSLEEEEKSSFETTERYPLMSRSEFMQALMCYAINKRNDPVTSIEDLFQILSGIWSSISAVYLIYASPSVRKLTIDSYALLRQTFYCWATHHPVRGVHLSLSDLKSMLTAATLIDADDHQICMTKVAAAYLTPTKEWELDYLVFAEFLEIVSQISIQTFAGKDDYSKVKLAFSFIIELGTRATRK